MKSLPKGARCPVCGNYVYTTPAGAVECDTRALSVSGCPTGTWSSISAWNKAFIAYGLAGTRAAEMIDDKWITEGGLKNELNELVKLAENNTMDYVISNIERALEGRKELRDRYSNNDVEYYRLDGAVVVLSGMLVWAQKKKEAINDTDE